LTDREGWGEHGWPYFFLSYAHTPADSQVDGDPVRWTDRLYKDLCAAVTELADPLDLPRGEPPGFMDRRLRLGEGWAGRLSEALAHCRVFVPVYSPRYFRSVACGQEWSAFASRSVFRTPESTAHSSGIVPVLWVPMPERSLPPVAGRLQFDHNGFGADYAREGMYALLKLNYFRNSYELAVHRLAQRIVETAEQTMIKEGSQEDFVNRPSAFGEPVPARQLRISVLACDAERLPPGRSPEAYGQSPLDWQPYWSASTRPLVEHADRVARQLGFHPSIHEFEEEMAAVLRSEEPKAPGLLLLDRWALLDPEHRDLVKAFDRRNPAWITLLEPWNEDDPDCRREAPELQGAVEEVLRHRRRDQRPSLRSGFDGLPTLETFEDEFPHAARLAMYGFAGRDKAAKQEATGRGRSKRPSLRDGPGGDPDGGPGHEAHPPGHDPPGSTEPPNQ
jgi:FxsC-like protein